MKKHPFLYVVIGVAILIIPTFIYLWFLVPRLTEEYNVLMASGGIVGGGGLYAASKIPESIKGAKLYKLAANSFTLLTVQVIIQKFAMQIIGLIAVFIISFIIYKIFMGAYKNGKRRKENGELAEQIARSIVKNS